MSRKAIDLTGKTFNSWTVMARSGSDKRGNAVWKCKCKCGEIKDVESSCLRKGISKNCGCERKPWTPSKLKTRKFKKCNSKLATVWRHMMARCYDPDEPRYADWGGRGIDVFRSWHNRENFCAWAEDKFTEGLELDRVDNDKGYYPDNCRFVTPKVNSNNRRVPRDNQTGYVGVYLRSNCSYRAYIRGIDPPMNGKLLHIGTFGNRKEAVNARNEFIIAHGLPHKLQEIVK